MESFLEVLGFISWAASDLRHHRSDPLVTFLPLRYTERAPLVFVDGHGLRVIEFYGVSVHDADRTWQERAEDRFPRPDVSWLRRLDLAAAS